MCVYVRVCASEKNGIPVIIGLVQKHFLFAQTQRYTVEPEFNVVTG